MGKRFLRYEVDDIGKRNTNKYSYRARVLAGKFSTADAYTRKRVYINNRYSSKSKINIDHVVSIDSILSRYGDYLDKSDLKEIIVRDSNLVATNEKLNKAKGAKSNFQYIVDNIDHPEMDITTATSMLLYQTYAEIDINSAAIQKIISKKIIESQRVLIEKSQIDKIINNDKSNNKSLRSKNKNVKSDDNQLLEATELMLYSAAISSVEILYRSYNGELSKTEAAKEIIKETGIMIGSVVIDEMLHEISKVLENKGINNASDYFRLQTFTTTINSAISIIKYINSDIDGYQCINSLIFNLIKAPAYSIAYAVGGPLAALITTSIVSEIQVKVSSWIYEWQTELKLSKQQIKRYDKLIEDFNNKIQSDRIIINEYIQRKNQSYNSFVLDGYYKLCQNIKLNDIKGVTNSLNQILMYFDKEILFKNLDIFDEFFFDDNKVIKI